MVAVEVDTVEGVVPGVTQEAEVVLLVESEGLIPDPVLLHPEQTKSNSLVPDPVLLLLGGPCLPLGMGLGLQ